MFTFDLTKIFLLTFLELLILHLRSISTRIENKFRKLPPFYYIGVDSTYLLGAIFWPKGQKVDIIFE